MKRVPFSEAVARKFPESVVLIVAPDEDGDPNVMPAGWSMFTSNDPLMIAVSVGLERYTHGLLEAAADYVIAFPSEAQTDDIVFCGSNSGADVDKVAASGLSLAEPAVGSTPILEDAAACFECRPGPAFRTGDHTVFAGEVVAAHVSETHEERVKNLGRAWGDGPERFKTLSQLLEMDRESVSSDETPRETARDCPDRSLE
ncbi:flavin reductase family protein [Natrononativus amylolyticus]|uniref:flavin reductase family protein n=1 Tax=Natrononativus amylolyticus TaxID=2963434 RepID=UPI0020CCC140|nr:flavin reductase family protein [Natrononativus amylolyticus]